MAASASHGESYCIQEEIELLEAIFIHELTVRESSERPSSLSITLHPSTGDEEHKKYVCLTLDIELPTEYPNILPSIVIRNPRGLSEAHVNSIMDNLQELAREQLGGPMLYELIQYAKDSLTDNNIPSCECAICLCHFQDSHSFTRTECYHFFHCGCLARFIEFYQKEEEKREQIECPVCRLPIKYDPDALKAVPLTDTENIELNYKPSDEIKELQVKMAAAFEEQKRKGGIIDVEQERNKFLIDISSTPQHESSNGELVLQPHSGQISDLNSLEKEREDFGSKESFPKDNENPRRKKTRQQNTARPISRNSQRHDQNGLSQRTQRDKRGVKGKKQIPRENQNKDKLSDSFSNTNETEMLENQIGQIEVNTGNAESKVNSRNAEANIILTETKFSSKEKKEKESDIRKNSKKPKCANIESKNDFKSNMNNQIGGNTGLTVKQRTHIFKDEATSSGIKIPDTENHSLAELKVTAEENKVCDKSNTRSKRERTKKSTKSKADKYDDHENNIPKTDNKKEVASNLGVEENDSRETLQIGNKTFDEQQKYSPPQSEKQRSKRGKVWQSLSEDSEKKLNPAKNSEKRLLEQCKMSSVNNDWPGLKSDTVGQRTKYEKQKKQSKKSKNHEDKKLELLPRSESPIATPVWSDVAKTGLSSTLRDVSSVSSSKSRMKDCSGQMRQEQQKQKEIPLKGMEDPVFYLSKSEKQEQCVEVLVKGAKPPPGFEGKNSKIETLRPPPGFEGKRLKADLFRPLGLEDKVSKPLSLNPPPRFEHLDLTTEP